MTVAQGNEIIERIQNENRTLKSKMRMKAKIIKQQEQVRWLSAACSPLIKSVLSLSYVNLQFVEEKQLQREEALLELKSTKEDVRKRDEHILQLKVRKETLGTFCL